MIKNRVRSAWDVWTTSAFSADSRATRRARPWPRRDTPYREPLLLLLITAAGLALRFYGAGDRDLWTDEAAKIAIAKLPWPMFWDFITGGYEQNPPLSFILLGSTMARLGDSLLSYRILSILAGTITILVTYALGRDLFHKGIGLLAAGLVAISPYFIAHSQEANHYSMLGLACAVSTWRFWSAICRPSKGNWCIYALSTDVALYVHHYAALVVLCQVAYLLGIYLPAHGRLPRGLPFGYAVLVTVYAPHLPITLGQFQSASTAGYIGRSLPAYLAGLMTNTVNLGSGYRLGEFSDLVGRSQSSASLPRLAELLAISGVPAGLAAWGVVVTARRGSNAAIYGSLLFIGSSLVGSYTLFLARHAIIVGAVYQVLIAAAILSLRGRLRAGLVVGLLLVDIVSLHHFYVSSWSRSRPQDWAMSTQQILAGMKVGDTIAVTSRIGGAFAFVFNVWSIAGAQAFGGPEDGSAVLHGPVPRSWALMEGRTRVLKAAYTWQVVDGARLVETTQPEYLSGDIEAARLAASVCSSCRLWVLFDSWDTTGWPEQLVALRETMAVTAAEDRAPFLRLMVLQPIQGPRRP